MIGPISLCYGCKHFYRDGEKPFTCKAYPDGIPIKIVAWVHDHRKPYAGDGGIRFEPDPKHMHMIEDLLDLIDRRWPRKE